LFRLALHCGVWDVDALAEQMPMPLFWEWVAYFRLHPFGDEWRRTAKLATIVAAAAGARVDETFEDKFIPGGGRFRGMTQSEVEMWEELRKIPEIKQQFDRRR
jgi:hypothetical protein